VISEDGGAWLLVLPAEEDLLRANEQLDELVGAPRSGSVWAQRWNITEAGLRALEAEAQNGGAS
jgi:hypothetical protein